MSRKQYVNENAFDSIDNEEKAYWLGFIYADGNVSDYETIYKTRHKAVYRIEVSLKSDDIGHLEKLKKFLGWEGKVKISKTNFTRSDRCRLFFNSKHMWHVLTAYGCTPKKSLTLVFPDLSIFKDKTVVPHFIRGYVDGDGCISYLAKDKKKMALSILGTKSMLTGIQQNLPLERSNKLWKSTNNNVYDLTFNLWRGYYVCNVLYKNATIYLDRKFNKYKEYCRIYEES